MVKIGRPHPLFDDVDEIAVLRGGGLGDLVFAMPALDALRSAYPSARITLLGTPAAKTLLEGRAGSVDAVEVLPFAAGVRDGQGTDDDETVDHFVDRLHGTFDLAVQAHGGGRNANPFLLRLGARHTVGTATDDAARLERVLRYEYYQHETLRWLEVAGLAGASATTLDPVLLVSDAERTAARTRLRASGVPEDGRRLVLMHPGATDPRRRWPEERFVEVAEDRLRRGDAVVVIGDETDVPAARAIVAGTHGAAASVAGTLPLGELPGLLALADVVIADDSGPRHLAVAVGTPTVGVFWFGNVINAGPFERGRHRIEMSFVTRCPVCGVDVTQVGWTAERCEHDPSFVAEVSAERVIGQVADLVG